MTEAVEIGKLSAVYLPGSKIAVVPKALVPTSRS